MSPLRSTRATFTFDTSSIWASEPQIFFEIVHGNMIASHRVPNQVSVLDN